MATTSASSGLRKRAQIAKANRTMFLWIAVSSAVVGAAIVVAIFLGRQLIYTEKVLAEKNTTASTLDANIQTIPKLREAIRVLDTNQALASAKAKESDQAVQVVLDALPSDANSLALGASLQQRLLTGVDGIGIETMQVDPVVGVESATSNDTIDAAPAADTASTAYAITFRFTINGNADSLKKVLQNMERSIRLIDITSLGIESGENSQQLTVAGQAYYEPSKKLELTDKVVKK